MMERERVLMERVTALEARLGMDSSNSSKPPSSDPPSAPPRPPREKGKRKAGGQPGHEGRTWQKFSADEVDKVVPLVPDRCRHCGHDFEPGAPHPRAVPLIFQVAELPPVKLHVTEYQRFSRACRCCKKKTRAELPDGVGPSPLGPRLSAVVAVLAYKYRLTRRLTRDLIADLVSRRFSIGTIQAVIERASEAVADTASGIRTAINQAPAVNADESGWMDTGQDRPKKRRFWLWAASAQGLAYFHVAPDRGAAGLSGILDAGYDGTLMVDRWRVYESVFGEKRQLCWSHLKREFKSAVDRGQAMTRAGPGTDLEARGQALADFGARALAIIKAFFRLWHRFKDGELSRVQFQKRMVRHEAAMRAVLKVGATISDKKGAAVSNDLLRQWPELWRFIDEEGVEPTNNRGERTLRQAVILRKLTLGTRSEKGRKAVGRLLSVVETVRQQGRNVLDFVTNAIQRKLLGQAAPQLIPRLSG